MPAMHNYARVEYERRFLIERFPAAGNVTAIRQIEDRYIENTRLRLRRMTSDDREVFKLTQKIPENSLGARQGFITSIYLSRTEFEVFGRLPAKTLSKTRHSVPPVGIDVFHQSLDGLILAEAEFESPLQASAFAIPSFACAEVTDDLRFTGASLVTATRQALRSWLADYGITLC